MLSPAISRIFWRALPRVTVPISSLASYAGFRYGRSEHPYERYIIDRRRGNPDGARESFIDSLCHYRPRDLGEALDINLSQRVPLWCFPWYRYFPWQWTPERGWYSRAALVPDVMTYFSEEGILMSRIEKEFRWLDRAMASMTSEGYRPEAYRNFVEVVTLQASDFAEVHIVHDGNHRVAALAALGESTIKAVRLGTVRASEVDRWPAVRAGRVSVSDAIAIFRAYFAGRARLRIGEPARVITSP